VVLCDLSNIISGAPTNIFFHLFGKSKKDERKTPAYFQIMHKDFEGITYYKK
jgi:hypothetical protein